MIAPYVPDGSSRHQDILKEPDSLHVIDKHSVEYVVRSGIAGGIAGSASKTLIAPLDRVKILFQTSNPEYLKYRGKFWGLFEASKNIWATDGFLGLYQGHSVTLIRIFPYAAIKFVTYEQIRTLLIPNDDYETAIRRFLSGSLSGLTSVFFTYPLDLVRVRMAFETKSLHHPAATGKSYHDHKYYMMHKKGRLMSTIEEVFHEVPPKKLNNPFWFTYLREKLPSTILSISNFYRGFAPTIFGMIPYAGVSFYTHDLIHDIFRSPFFADYAVPEVYMGQLNKLSSRVVKRTSSSVETTSHDTRVPLKAWAQLIAGALAGMCSQTAAYPFEVIRRRMQVSGAVNKGQYISFTRTSKIIFAENGFKGFFVGLTIGYVKVIPMVACTFYLYERSKILLGI